MPIPARPEPRNLFNENFIDSYLPKFKFHEIKALYGSSKADARLYIVYAIFSGILIFRVESEEALIIELA